MRRLWRAGSSGVAVAASSCFLSCSFFAVLSLIAFMACGVGQQCYGLPASRVDGVVRARAGIRRKRLDSFGPMVGTPAQRSGGGVMRASLSSTPSAFSPWHCALCVASASQSISQRRGDLPSSDGFDGSLPPMCLLCPRRVSAFYGLVGRRWFKYTYI